MKIKLKNQIIFLVVIMLFSACASSPSDLSEDEVKDATSVEKTAATPSAVPLPVFEIIPSPALTKFEMIDEKNGWGQAEGMVLRTEDGGETWLDITPIDIYNNPAYSKSFFIDEKIAWFLLEDIDKPTGGVIFRTTDGGANWLWRNTPFGRSYIGFMDTEKGYALTGLGAGAGSMGVAIWTTINGGGDFNRVFLHQPGFDDSLPLRGIKNGISFRDPQNGWVSGSQPQNGFAYLYRTRDGGFSWEHQELTMPQFYEEAQTSVGAPLFFDDGLGVLPVQLFSEESATVFYRTTDSGETWTPTFPVPMRGKYSVLSANEIVLWDGISRVYASQDGGKTWNYNAAQWQPDDTLRKIDFISVMIGLALTDEGLYRTEDGGLTWEKLGD